MDVTVLSAVLLAAAMHAGWNALVKIDLDRFLAMTLISLSAGVIASATIVFVRLPSLEAWPYLLVSALLNTGYKLFLIRAYQAGDFGQVYPLARGTAPLLTSLAMPLLFSEGLSTMAAVGVVLLALGVWLMSVRGGRDLRKLEAPAVIYAIGTSAFIASYTITDGLGARANGDATGYAAWLFLLNGVMMLLLLLATRGSKQLRCLRPYWIRGIFGGGMILGAYGIVIWATTVAPIAQVAAIRESSVLWATVISAIILREPLSRWRLISSLMIICGIVLARMP